MTAISKLTLKGARGVPPQRRLGQRGSPRRRRPIHRDAHGVRASPRHGGRRRPVHVPRHPLRRPRFGGRSFHTLQVGTTQLVKLFVGSASHFASAQMQVLPIIRCTNFRVPRNLAECFEGTFAAHNEDNETDALSGRCLRKMPDAVDGDEESVNQLLCFFGKFFINSRMSPN